MNTYKPQADKTIKRLKQAKRYNQKKYDQLTGHITKWQKTNTTNFVKVFIHPCAYIHPLVLLHRDGDTRLVFTPMTLIGKP